MSMSLRTLPVRITAQGETALTKAWRLHLRGRERDVWDALVASSEGSGSLSFEDLAAAAGQSMNATKYALYELQKLGLVMGMPDV